MSGYETIALHRQHLDGLNTSQLANRVQADRILPDTVNIGGQARPLADVLKDPVFGRVFEESLRTAHNGGTDMSKQIALVGEYREALTGHRRETTLRGNFNEESGANKARETMVTQMDRGTLNDLSERLAARPAPAPTPAVSMLGNRG